MADFYFVSGAIAVRVHTHANGEVFVDVLDTMIDGIVQAHFKAEREEFVTVGIAKAMAVRTIMYGIAKKRVLGAHLTWHQTPGGRRLTLLRSDNDGNVLNGLGEPWFPKVHKGGRVGGEFDIPSNTEDRKWFGEGVRDGFFSVRPPHPDIFLTKHPEYVRGFGLVRRVLKEQDQPALVKLRDMFFVKKIPKPRKHRMSAYENPRYEVKNRGPRGSGRGTWQHVGGKHLKSKRALALHFALSDEPGHTSGAFWTDGVVLYSFMQPIAKKRVLAASYPAWHAMRVCEIDGRTFSPTTTEHQNHARAALSHGGWHVEQRNLGPPKRRS